MKTNYLPILLTLVCGTALAAENLRPLSTDRPDTTESPHTVDAGRFQFEMEVIAWTRDGGSDTLSLSELNAKYGLTPSTDLHLVVPFYTRESSGPAGFGDLTLRLKHNLWGNDSGSTAFAIMPFLKLPTASNSLSNGAFEGGITLPFATEGPGDWGFGFMAELELAEDEDGSGHHLALLASAVASHPLTEKLAAFGEFALIEAFDDDTRTEAYFNAGFTFALATTCQLDGGLRIGLTSASTDLTPFLGISRKF